MPQSSRQESCFHGRCPARGLCGLWVHHLRLEHDLVGLNQSGLAGDLVPDGDEGGVELVPGLLDGEAGVGHALGAKSQLNVGPVKSKINIFHFYDFLFYISPVSPSLAPLHAQVHALCAGLEALRVTGGVLE